VRIQSVHGPDVSGSSPERQWGPGTRLAPSPTPAQAATSSSSSM
jgi:hypothetical protein